MDTAQAAERFNERFMETYQRFYRRVRPTAYRPGPEALAVLRHLYRAGPLTVSEAARHFSRSQASTSELISRIESRGLVSRVADERDHRRKLIWLTDEGIEALEQSVRVLSVPKLEHAFQQMTPAARTALVAAMEQLLSTDRQPGGWDDE